MPATPPTRIATYLVRMAEDIDRAGLFVGGPNFADLASNAVDVPGAAYRAVTGQMPFLFAFPTTKAAEQARQRILATSAAMDTLNALAEHMAQVWPDLDWTDDPIERLAHWPHLLGVKPEEIPQTLRDLAHTLTAPAPTAA